MGGSQVYLKPGETFSLDDMMKAIIVHSANDASVAVAEYIAGSTEAFVLMMNPKAEKLGMKDRITTRCTDCRRGRAAGRCRERLRSGAAGARVGEASADFAMVLDHTAPFRAGTFDLRNTNHLVSITPDATASRPDSITRPASTWSRPRIAAACG